MVFELLSQVEDLSSFPRFNKKKVGQVTLGDLHANAIKLIHTLVRFGVCEFKPVQYKKLLKLYTTEYPKTADKKAFLKLIKDELKIKNPAILVRLIGDIVADRGKNDLYVLAILDRLREQHVPVTTLISNHDIELILAYEAYKRTGVLDKRAGVGVWHEQKCSLSALADSIGEDGAILNEEFERLMEETYLPTLKLVDYSLSHTAPKSITIFSHAPIDLEVISHMAKKFGVTYQASTVEQLAHTIDAINLKFTSCVRDGNFSLIYDGNKIPSDYHVPKEHCVECAIWNRNEDLSAGSADIPLDRIHFVYGHTIGGAHVRANVSKIDNSFGKGARAWSEVDPVFVSDEAKPALQDAKLPPAEYLSEQILNENKLRWHEEKQGLLAAIKKSKSKAAQTHGFLKDYWIEYGKQIVSQISTYNTLLTLDMSSSPEELNRLNEYLCAAKTNAISDMLTGAIKEALSALKTYSAGTAVSKEIEVIQNCLDRKQFQAMEKQLKRLSKHSFEGLGEHAIDASERGMCEKAWYNLIAGIRFLLSCVMSLFTKDANDENRLAKLVLGRPFFFQKPKTKGESDLIQAKLDELDEEMDILQCAMKKPGALEP